MTMAMTMNMTMVIFGISKEIAYFSNIVLLIGCNIELTDVGWPPAGIARQISVSSGDPLDSSGSKQSGVCFIYSLNLSSISKSKNLLYKLYNKFVVYLS